MSFLGKANFVPMATPNCGTCVMSFRVTCLPLSHPFIFSGSFFPFLIMSTRTVISIVTEPSSFAISSSWCGYCYWCHTTLWAFYFQGSGLPLSVSGPWLGSMCRAHFALQELQAIAMMLYRMAFCLSGKVVVLHLDNSTAKATCVIKVLQCLLFFPGWPAGY